MRQVFRVGARKWRGLGEIPQSGLALQPRFARFDAETRFGVAAFTEEEPTECISGLVLQGLKKPHECPAFGSRCTPEHPLGATMVSSEGRVRRVLSVPSHSDRRGCAWPLTGARTTSAALACPIPITQYPHVLLAHGGGGQLMHQLIERLIVPAFGGAGLEARHDGAVFEVGAGRLAFTTDSYVVRPLFFPGGDIGALAVNGTVNDLAMCGARARYLSVSFILEEGLPMDTLWRIVLSMQAGGG